MNYTDLLQLEKAYGSAFFILDEKQLSKNYHRFIKAFSQYYPHINIGYSYKTNYIPSLLQQMDKLGAYAEVVSQMEYQLALKCGVQANRIIFNGPYKTSSDLSYALEHQSMLHIDNLAEMQQILEIIQTRPTHSFKVGLRCNFALDDLDSRFGLCLENGDLAHAFKTLNQQPNCQVVGLHCHYTTAKRTLASFRYRAMKMVEISQQLFQDRVPAYLNLGGGIFGTMDEQMASQFDCPIPSYEEYAQAIAPIIKQAYPDAAPELIMEPGVGLVANVVHFYSKIMYLKVIRNHHYAVCSGSIFNVKPSLHKKYLSIEHMPCAENKKEASKEYYDIVGYTCLEWDTLLEKYHGTLMAGDYIKFLNIGAYSIVFKPPFIEPAPPILSLNNEQMIVVKQAETFADIFRNYSIR